MPRQPCPYLRVFVRGVVIDNSLDRLPRRDLTLDGVEEPDELLMPVALHTAADHGAIQHIQRRE